MIGRPIAKPSLWLGLSLLLSVSLVSQLTYATPLKPSHLSYEEGLQWQVGKAIFEKLWVAAPASTRSSDGLGPLYNARSCHQCHERSANDTSDVTRPEEYSDTSRLFGAALVLKLGRHTLAASDPVYGQQIQAHAVGGLSAEGLPQVRYVLAPESGLSMPEYRLVHLTQGALAEGIQLAPRLAIPLIGMGALEAITEREIEALADPDDRDGDGISGRVSRPHGEQGPVGRFGWKAGQSSLDAQALLALNLDIGVSSNLFPQGAGDCTPRQIACRTHTFDEGLPEASAAMTAALLFFLRQQEPPAYNRVDATVQAGQQLFDSLQCSACHRPSFNIKWGEVKREIWPYSDLLLHDMGNALADPLAEADASGREWRTPPLWGLGQQMRAGKRAGFLHDGRARTLEEAILWHGGEAQSSRERYRALSSQAKADLLHFLESL